jgi:hypothetical protein
MKDLRDNEVRQAIRKAYGDIAKAGSSACDYGLSLCYGEVRSPLK